MPFADVTQDDLDRGSHDYGTSRSEVSKAAADVRYRIVMMGPGAKQRGPSLRRRLRKRLRELARDLPSFVGFVDAAAAALRDPKFPVVAVYFGGAEATSDDLAAIRSLNAAAAVIIPVVDDLSTFVDAVPLELRRINGVESAPGAPNIDSLVNLILENLGLLRRTRRLFISYRRTDAATEALQLRQEFDSRGFDAFLDTHSVPKGDDFQEVLWQRLADSDVVVILDTPGFLESRWTKEELARAAAMTIGVIQVVWPGHSPAPFSDLCERVYLEASDFRAGVGLGFDDRLTKELADAAERLRARSLGARHDNLVREFCSAASSVDVAATVQPDRVLSVALPSRRTLTAIPAVGVPDAFLYHDAHHRFAGRTSEASEIWLIYDHRGLRPEWVEFLIWLDQFLPVKGVRITDVPKRLRSC